MNDKVYEDFTVLHEEWRQPERGMYLSYLYQDSEGVSVMNSNCVVEYTLYPMLNNQVNNR